MRRGRSTRVFVVVFFTVVLTVWALLLYKVVTDAPKEAEGCMDVAPDCKQFVIKGRCRESSVRDKCRQSCGRCGQSNIREVHGETKTAPPSIGATRARDLPELFIGDVDLKLHKDTSSSEALDFLLETHAGLWKKASVSSLCSSPVHSAGGGDIVRKIQHMQPPLDSPKVLCMVYTMEKNHVTKVKAQTATWASGCDGFVAMSTVHDPSVPAIQVVHEGPEAWENMWQKVRSIWAWANSTQIENYDYFLIGGDDMYVFTPNYKAYLSTLDRKKPHYIGRRLYDPNGKVFFNAGGAGYTLSREALKVLANNLDNPKCEPHGKMFWEDVQVAKCLRFFDIVPVDTRDNRKAERFHPVGPDHLVHVAKDNWVATYSTQFIHGIDGISNESISFHYLSPDSMRAVHVTLKQCTT
eukprot:TRINITY_DN8005_c0_g1_i1.p1 TRINITY_DN8005_c0_g1~~TRINITY_DN8005_c0_g1_i1.p1  ORF type:complete len:410 (+),score=75.13 TRINITY_DN8005_c0_g1_i1:1166-2395(+)